MKVQKVCKMNSKSIMIERYLLVLLINSKSGLFLLKGFRFKLISMKLLDV